MCGILGRVNFSGKIYESFSYGLDESGDINYDEVQALAEEHKPKVIISGFSAFSGIIKWDRFREINAKHIICFLKDTII